MIKTQYIYKITYYTIILLSIIFGGILINYFANYFIDTFSIRLNNNTKDLVGMYSFFFSFLLNLFLQIYLQ
mgnify:CR=1 FL=1